MPPQRLPNQRRPSAPFARPDGTKSPDVPHTDGRVNVFFLLGGANWVIWSADADPETYQIELDGSRTKLFPAYNTSETRVLRLRERFEQVLNSSKWFGGSRPRQNSMSR
jgi:hypothetical protein